MGKNLTKKDKFRKIWTKKIKLKKSLHSCCISLNFSSFNYTEVWQKSQPLHLQVMQDLDLLASDFVRNAITCCTPKKTKKIKFYFTPAEIAITNKLQTIIAFM